MYYVAWQLFREKIHVRLVSWERKQQKKNGGKQFIGEW